MVGGKPDPGGRSAVVSPAAYKGYRRVGRELMTKVMNASLSRDALGRSAKLLGISSGGVFVFDSEEEMAVLMDFALNDYRTGSKNAIELYSAAKGPANEVEREILAGYASAYTSLFRIVSTSKMDGTLLLRDLLNDGDDVQLTDINLSKTAEPEFLLFIRVVPLRDFNITSGFIFAFPGQMESRLLAGYKRPAKKREPRDDAQRRFLRFLKAYRDHGIETRFE
jgi:hypothetical protein